MGNETSPRERLIAMVAVLRGIDGPVSAAWQAGEEYVAALEAGPDKPRECPCCTKLVTLCPKHYQLHEPGKKCSGCREDE